MWVDVAVAWVIAPLAGGSLELSLWGSIVPSWACVTVALGYGLRAEEVSVKREVFVRVRILVVSFLVALTLVYGRPY